MNCPKCPGELAPVEFQGVEIERCSSCQGLWFDAFEHEELKAMAGSEAIDIGASGVARDATHASLQCPKCAQKLFGMVVAGQPHIGIESCGVCHGVFFDAGEFKDFKDETFGERLRDLFRVGRSVTAGDER